MRILIAEDDHDLSRLFCETLREAGYEAVAAYDGASTIIATTRDPIPDLILLDLGMPAGNGQTVLRHLKRTPRTAGIPIVVLTARSDDATRADVLAQGAAAFHQKPISPQQLLDAVNVIASAQREREQRRRQSLGLSRLAQDIDTEDSAEQQRILIADDDMVLATLVREQFVEAGYVAYTAYDGASALMRVRRDPAPNLVLLDLQMPGGNGEIILKRIRSMPETTSLPVIAVSSDIDRGTEALALGANVFMPKPYDFTELLGHVSGLLAAQPS